MLMVAVMRRGPVVIYLVAAPPPDSPITTPQPPPRYVATTFFSANHVTAVLMRQTDYNSYEHRFNTCILGSIYLSHYS